VRRAVVSSSSYKRLPPLIEDLRPWGQQKFTCLVSDCLKKPK
jgi:hypothetical protein